MDETKLTKKNLIMFPIGTVGRDMIYQLFTNFLFTYVLFTRNLTPAQLAAITAIMVGARIFDALNDPIMGNIIERTRTRWGKFKPWLVIGILSTSLVVYLAFNTSLQGWNFIVFFGIIYFMYSITYTMHDISYWGMVPSLSSDADARNKFTARATLFAGIGGAIAGAVIPMFTTGENAIGGSAFTAYGKIALIICILAPLFLCFTIFGAKENRDYNKEPAPPISFKKIFSTITGNDQLMWIALIFLLQQIGNGIILGGIGSTFVYFDFGYNGGLYTLFSTVGLVATAFLMIFYPAISRRVKRKTLMNTMMSVSIAGYAVMLLAGLLLPSTMVKFWIITFGYMASNIGQYCFYLIMMISIINTVEYNELKNGTRDEAIIASLRPFLTKMASAITALITTVCYILFGVLNYTNQISDFERQASMGEISEAVKISGIGSAIANVHTWQILGLLLFMTILPCAFMLSSHLLYKKHYRLDEDEYNRICAELSSRKAAEKQ